MLIRMFSKMVRMSSGVIRSSWKVDKYDMKTREVIRIVETSRKVIRTIKK